MSRSDRSSMAGDGHGDPKADARGDGFTGEVLSGDGIVNVDAVMGFIEYGETSWKSGSIGSDEEDELDDALPRAG